MTTLEKRFFPRQEIAEIVGITNLKDKHFAEKVKRYLDNRKYGYDYSRKGVSITGLPETAEEQLASMLRNSLGLDIQVDAYHFACFINAFSAIKGFDAMPWITRTAIINQNYFFLSYRGKAMTQESVSKMMKQTAAAVNVRKDIRVSPHTCRHTFAHLQLKNGLDIYSLSRLLGHEHIGITQKYLNGIRDDEVLVAARQTGGLRNL